MAPAAAGSRGARGRLLILTFVLASALGASADARAAVPASWPFGKVEVGVHDPENAAASLRQRGPYGLRYHYLSGGANTGQGWRTWAEGNGSFVPKYVADSAASGFPATVFSYYQLYQSAPASGSGDEREAMLANLRNVDTMRAYYDDLETFFRRAAESSGSTVILHVEPDAWGYMQAAGGTASGSVPAAVASTGRPDLAGLPENATGFAQAIVRLRNAYAPKVLLGYHLSPWGSGIDPALSTHLTNERIDTAAAHSAAFYSSLGSSFDLVFAEYTNRDAGYMRVVEGLGPEADWTDEDFNWHARFIGDFARAVGRSVVMWQIPFGNTLMRAMNDTPFHYQDNKVERLLGDRNGTEMRRYTSAGAIAFLFGTAIDQTTCACDAAGDGITGPPPINGNVAPSVSADDDGGYFHQIAPEWYAERQPALSDAKVSATAKVGRAVPGERAEIRLRFTSSVALRAKLILTVARRGKKLDRIRRPARLAEGARVVRVKWRVPGGLKPGRAQLGLVVKQRGGGTVAADPTLAKFRVRKR